MIDETNVVSAFLLLIWSRKIWTFFLYKKWANLGLSLFIFVLFSENLYRNVFKGIWNKIVGVEGTNTDRKTTTTSDAKTLLLWYTPSSTLSKRAVRIPLELLGNKNCENSMSLVPIRQSCIWSFTTTWLLNWIWLNIRVAVYVVSSMAYYVLAMGSKPVANLIKPLRS